MQDPGKARELCPDKTLVFGEPFERLRRGGEQGVGHEALMRAEKGTQGLRDSEGAEKMRPRELFVQVVLEPLGSFLLLALGTGAVATGMIDAVVPPTAWALREAMAVMAALALWEGADDLSV
jgi:hypothetical protein